MLLELICGKFRFVKPLFRLLLKAVFNKKLKLITIFLLEKYEKNVFFDLFLYSI